jgi:uncharacterized protein (DUF302 family)
VSEYGYSVEVSEGYDEAVVRTRLALRGEGFSILTEAHVGGLLAPETGTERQYLIMSSWSTMTTQELGSPNLRAAIQLPCNVVVQERGATALVAALDPEDSLVPEDEDTVKAAVAAKDALGRALKRIATAS